MKKDTEEKEKIDNLIAPLNVDMLNIVNAIRALVLGTDPLIKEQVKWNSPSFFYTGALKNERAKDYPGDILVLHTRKKLPLLIFPSGKLIDSFDHFFDEKYDDGRKMIQIKSQAHFELIQIPLSEMIKEWIQKSKI